MKKLHERRNFILGLALGVAITMAGSVLAAWSEPANNPPLCPLGTVGCAIPIDIGSSIQVKNGPMGATLFNADYVIANGGVRYIKNDKQDCIPDTEGMMRYSAMKSKMQFCNGANWITIAKE